MKHLSRPVAQLLLALGLSSCASLWAQGTFVYTNDNVAAANTVSGFSVGSNGALTLLSGFPVSTGGTGTGGGLYVASRILASPLDDFLYVANGGSGNVSVFSIDPGTGSLTAVPGSPFATATPPGSPQDLQLAVTPDNKFLLAVEVVAKQITVFSIGSNGALTVAAGSPYSISYNATGLKVTPDGKFLAVVLADLTGNATVDQIAMYSIGSDGTLTAVPGSPFSTAPNSAVNVDVNCGANTLFAFETNTTETEAGVFAIAANGSLSQISGSPFSFSSGAGSNGGILSPNGQTLFVSNQFSGTVTALTAASGGALSLVAGSPFAANVGSCPLTGTGTCPAGMAMNAAGTFLFVASISPEVAVFSAAANGVLTAVAGSPFSSGQAGSAANSLALSPPQVCGAAANLSAASVAFGNQLLGTTSASQSVTLTNPNPVYKLTITSITLGGSNATDFSLLSSGSCPYTGGTVMPASSCTVDIAFTPSAEGSLSATVSVADNAADSPQSISLTGTGTEPVVSLSPATLPAFASQAVGTTSAAQSITLSNTGTAALSITSIAIAGANGADFAQTNNCGSSVAAGGSCTLNVTFAPQGINSRTGTLTITDNDHAVADSTQTFTLTGTGLGGTASLSVAVLTFSGENVGMASSTSTVTLTNNGNASLSISSIAISGSNGGDFALQSASTCSTTAPVAAGKSCTVQVTFKPTGSGTRSATLTITDNAVGSATQTVSLTGTGKDFSLAVSAPASVSAGQSASYTLTLTPLSGFTDTLQITCAEPSSLTESTCTASPASVTPKGSAAATVTVTVTTTATQSRGAPRFRFPGLWSGPWPGHPGLPLAWLLVLGMLAALRLRPRTSAPRRRLARLATGWAIITLVAVLWAACGGGGGGSSPSPPPPAPVVSLSPSSLTFNSQNVSTTSASQSVTLSNTGNAALTISTIATTGDFAQTSNCSTSVAAGANCRISVTFKPTTNGQRTGSLSVTDNASGSPQSVSLTGAGVKPGTPAGNYNVTLTVNGGGVTHTTTAVLTVH